MGSHAPKTNERFIEVIREAKRTKYGGVIRADDNRVVFRHQCSSWMVSQVFDQLQHLGKGMWKEKMRQRVLAHSHYKQENITIRVQYSGR